MPIFLPAMPRASRLAVALAIAIAPVAPAFAADDVPVDLARVVVRGKHFPANTVDDIAQARERLDERAGATALVDGDSYRDGRVGNLADALGHAPGVFVQPRFGAEEARLSIRGSGLQRTFHGMAALLGMLTSCASGVTVVNIDNGFGAAFAAARILRAAGGGRV